MKKISIRQYIATLIVCFLAIAILSFCTIQAFYKKSVNDTLSLGESALKQQKEQMDAYLSRGMDAVEVTAINIEYMLRENYSNDDILSYLKQESKYYKEDVDVNFTGIYGVINDGSRKMIMCHRTESGTRQQLKQMVSRLLFSRILMHRLTQ